MTQQRALPRYGDVIVSSDGVASDFTPLLVGGGHLAWSRAGLLSQPRTLSTFEQLTEVAYVESQELTGQPTPSLAGQLARFAELHLCAVTG